MKTAIHFGAGNIGRGFIGSLLSRAHYEVIFVDVNMDIINELTRRKQYTLETVGDTSIKEEEITKVTGLSTDDPQLMNAFIKADLVTTAVGPNVLPRIAPLLAKGIAQRKPYKTALNCIACENMLRASSYLKEEVKKHLPSDCHEYYSQMVGFPDAAVDRIVPPLAHRRDLLSVRVEEFHEWIVDETAFVGPLPRIAGMQPTRTLSAFVERKLFTLNTGHAITAYLGHLRQHRYILESITDEAILSIVKNAMRESGTVLIQDYGFEEDAHEAYIEKILLRFRNPWLKDEVTRVGRDPVRKLKPDDRLIKPLRGTLRLGTEHHNLITGIAAALKFRNDADPQARTLKETMTTKPLTEAISVLTSLKGDVVEEIAEAYQHLDRM